MTQATLANVKVAILATDGFEQSEMTQPRQALDQAGAKTVLVSLKPGEIRSWSGKDWGDRFKVDLAITDAHARDFDALVLPGGVMNPDHLRINAAAVAFVKAFVDAKKPIAAICHGPWTLINAGGVAGKRMTSWPSLEADLRNAGANWIDDQCVVDGALVTSRKPDDLPAFCAHMVKLFDKAVAHA
jgi:protease I